MAKKEEEKNYAQAYNGADCATTEPIETGTAPGTESKDSHDSKIEKEADE